MYDLRKIRVLAKEKNVKIKDLAKHLKLGEHAIQSMIRNNSTKKSTLEQISKYFNVNVDYFLTNTVQNVSSVISVSNNDVLSSKPKVIIQIELSEEDGNKVLKMVMGKDFTNLLNK